MISLPSAIVPDQAMAASSKIVWRRQTISSPRGLIEEIFFRLASIILS
jgi:hypothetical protein